MAHGLGVTIKIPEDKRVDHYLFAESLGRFLVSIDSRQRRLFESAAAAIPCHCLGTVNKSGRLEVLQGETKYVDVSIKELLGAYQQPFAGF